MAGVGILAACLISAGASATPITFRTATSVDLTNLDPIATTEPATIIHGLMVYDTLFALDAHGDPQPQMVDTYSVSPDGLVHRFKLRPGLLFSDGSAVESKDVIASLERWASKRSQGHLLNARLDTIIPIDDTSFEIRLKRPFAQLIGALANPDLPMFVMRKQEADTDPSVPITKVVGSGPFVFRQDLWRRDDIVVYDKSPTYVPRNEPANGQAGGKVVNVDRVEERCMPNDTALEALKNGVLDFVYSPPQDEIATLRQDPDFTVGVLDRQGMMGAIRLNTRHAPFDNVYARLAVQAAVDQTTVLSSMVDNAQMYHVCYSIFDCDVAPAGAKLGADQGKGWNIADAKTLLQKSDYDGRPIVVMIPVDDDQLQSQGVTLVKLLRDVGFTVDAQTMVSSTLAARRENASDPAKDHRGWDIFGTWMPSDFFEDPFGPALDMSGDLKTGWYGWPKDKEIQSLRDALVDASSQDARRTIINKIQARYYETIPQVYTGKFYIASVWRSNITGVLSGNYPVFWNLRVTE